jgi:sn-glycerol 3-phosphate transport system ATP-binding protein
LGFDAQVIEPLGANQLVHGLVGGIPFVVNNSDADLVTLGHHSIYVDPCSLHFFDGRGKRIGNGQHTHDMMDAIRHIA